jgi:hypothetical protein
MRHIHLHILQIQNHHVQVILPTFKKMKQIDIILKYNKFSFLTAFLFSFYYNDNVILF